MIFQRVEAVVEDNSWDHGVCWENLGGYMASNDRGACDLTETVGSPTSAADIWSGIMLVETDYSARSESCFSGNGLLVRYRCLMEIFGQGPCWFGIFG